jgi:DNA-directed RNA polymerase specialized sigma24 family protein
MKVCLLRLNGEIPSSFCFEKVHLSLLNRKAVPIDYQTAIYTRNSVFFLILPMSILSAGDGFPETSITLVGRLRSTDAALRTEAIRLVARRYWLPLYDFSRRTGLSEHAAADAVQDFFQHILTNSEGFATYDGQQGRLRTWIITIYRHRLSSSLSRQQAQIRGGGMEHIPLDFVLAESHYLEHASEDKDNPEKAFDRSFARQLWQQVLGTLRCSYNYRNRLQVYETLHPLILSEVKDQPYSSTELAKMAGLPSMTDFKVSLHRLRKEAAHEFQRLVQQTVEGDDWQEEVRYLLLLVG